jgi:hypothetical protein
MQYPMATIDWSGGTVGVTADTFAPPTYLGGGRHPSQLLSPTLAQILAAPRKPPKPARKVPRYPQRRKR